ncbi:MAG: delayed-early response protein/equilibrative nucleoside transporter [Rhizobium sp. 63-7]|nr:MAG: delayed-early response protein/equilibrative nucleoside transporter [Rhizobium sp. 63-7]
MLNRRNLWILCAATLFAAAAGLDLAHAQSPLGIGSAEPGIQVSGPFAGLFAWVNGYQQAFYRALTGALKAMRQDPWQLGALIGLSFAYGVFHAAGPGHGKAVISSYMIANETELKRGVMISFLSAFMQGLVAILLVGAAYLVLRGSSVSMTQATQALEIASFAMIALFGAWLLFRKIRSLRLPLPQPELQLAGVGNTVFAVETPETVSHRAAHHGHAHDHHHHHHGHHDHHHAPGVVCETCGHAHAPDPEMLRAERFNVREAWSAIVAVGLRPCSGALLVMTFSLLNGLYLGGVLSVLAMSVGTAITVSTLATLAVTAKSVALRFAGRGSPTAAWVGNGIEILGAVFVMLMGLLLLGAALQA